MWASLRVSDDGGRLCFGSEGATANGALVWVSEWHSSDICSRENTRSRLSARPPQPRSQTIFSFYSKAERNGEIRLGRKKILHLWCGSLQAVDRGGYSDAFTLFFSLADAPPPSTSIPCLVIRFLSVHQRRKKRRGGGGVLFWSMAGNQTMGRGETDRPHNQPTFTGPPPSHAPGYLLELPFTHLHTLVSRKHSQTDHKHSHWTLALVICMHTSSSCIRNVYILGSMEISNKLLSVSRDISTHEPTAGMDTISSYVQVGVHSFVAFFYYQHFIVDNTAIKNLKAFLIPTIRCYLFKCIKLFNIGLWNWHWKYLFLWGLTKD